MKVSVGGKTYEARSVDEAIEKARSDPSNTKVYRGHSAEEDDPGESITGTDAYTKALEQARKDVAGLPTDSKGNIRPESASSVLSKTNLTRNNKYQVQQQVLNLQAQVQAQREEQQELQAIEAEKQKALKEAEDLKKYKPENLTKEMRDRLLTWADDPANPTVGWDTMAEKLNVNPQAVIEAKRQLKETISKIPGAGQTVEGILSGAIWNNPIVTDVIRQMVDSPQGRRWEGDVGVVYEYLAGRDMGTGAEQVETNTINFRSEGHGLSGGPGRHPTQTFTAFDDYEMAKEAGTVTGPAGNIAKPPAPYQAGDWTLTDAQLQQMYPTRYRDVAAINGVPQEPRALGGLSGIDYGLGPKGETPYTADTGGRDEPIYLEPGAIANGGAGGPKPAAPYPQGGGGSTPQVGSSILDATDPSNFSATGFLAKPNQQGAVGTRPAAPMPQVVQQVNAPAQQVMQGGANMVSRWNDPYGGITDWEGEDSPLSAQQQAQFGMQGMQSPWLNPWGEQQRDWADYFSGALSNLFQGRGSSERAALSTMLPTLSAQYLLGSYVAPRDQSSPYFSEIPGIGVNTRWQDYIQNMLNPGGGQASPTSFAQGPGLSITPQGTMRKSLAQAADIINRPVMSQEGGRGFTARESGLRDFLNDETYGRDRQIGLAIGSQLAGAPGWIRQYASRGAENLMRARMAAGGSAQASPLQSFINRGYTF